MPRDKQDLDLAEEPGTVEEESAEDQKDQKDQKDQQAAKDADVDKAEGEEKDENEEKKRKEQAAKEAEAKKNEALNAIKDIAVLAKNLRDIARERALEANEKKGEDKLDRTAVVKEAYADPCEHLTEAEFLELEKAVSAIGPFLLYPYPKPGQKPYPYPKPAVPEKGEGDFADPKGTNTGHLSKADADAIRSFVNDTAPKMVDALTKLTERVS